jgi:hypothetical protein
MSRWFRIAVAVEIAGVVACVVVGTRLLTQGAHVAGDALTWMRPSHHAPALPSSPADPGGVAPLPLPHATSNPMIAGAAMLTPELLARLNRQTRAFAMAEYQLLLDLEELTRNQAERLLDGVHVPPAP